jgi:hypothetical protein
VDLMKAHLDRHVAELLRRRGDYAGAHRLLTRAMTYYESVSASEALAHSRIVRAHTLRLEGLAAAAITDADWARECFLSLGRRHGELMATAVLAEVGLTDDTGRVQEHLTTLVAQPRWIYPSGPVRGHLGFAELARRQGATTEALHHYEEALRVAGGSEVIGALDARIGRAAVRHGGSPAGCLGTAVNRGRRGRDPQPAGQVQRVSRARDRRFALARRGAGERAGGSRDLQTSACRR